MEVHPRSSRIDEPAHIRVGHVPPGTSVTLRARTFDGARIEWASWATFVAGDGGVVDPGVQAPSEGSYSGVDPEGLLWSMGPVDPRSSGAFFLRGRPTPLRFELTAEVDGTVVARCAMERRFTDTSVDAHPIDEPGLVGALYSQSTCEPAPGVIILGGSDGGELSHAAALLAAHGYAALALAYFGAEHLPATLSRIDLAYFEAALGWIARRPEVAPGQVAVIGLSRGAELALQLGSMHEQIGAVIAGAPSGFRHPGLGKYADYSQAAWLLGGEPLPFVASRFTARDAVAMLAVFGLKRPLRLVKSFRRSMRRNRQAVEAAAIEAERIRGPIMLISGTADQLWQSGEFAEQIMARLRERQHPYHDVHLSCDGSGHFVCFPYALPSIPPVTRMSPAPRMTIDFGGTPERNAASARRSWPEILRFLERHTKDSRR